MKKKKKENSTELQKPNVEAEVYNNNKNKKYDREENKIKSLIKLHSANKINNCNGRRGEGKIFKSMYRTSQNIKIVNVFLESLLSESFPSLGVTVYLTSLG